MTEATIVATIEPGVQLIESLSVWLLVREEGRVLAYPFPDAGSAVGALMAWSDSGGDDFTDDTAEFMSLAQYAITGDDLSRPDEGFPYLIWQTI